MSEKTVYQGLLDHYIYLRELENSGSLDIWELKAFVKNFHKVEALFYAVENGLLEGSDFELGATQEKYSSVSRKPTTLTITFIYENA